jgi:hypothetical protein
MPSKKQPKKSVSPFVYIGVPLAIVITDLWVASYFWAKTFGTWMTFPIFITALLVLLVAILVFAYFVGDEEI